MIGRALRVVLVSATAWGCMISGCASRPVGETSARLFDGMGPHTRRITAKDATSQEYFNQGLVWAYAFNHDEAIRSFREAARLDPSAAMPWWGIALCNGPHINNPVREAARSEAAFKAVQEAKARMAGAAAVERALILAVEQRYAWPEPKDPRALDEAYAAAMGRVHAEFPNDADVATLYAEAMMDLQPWDLWEKDGRAKGQAETIVATLEAAMRLNPKHPGATHLYIHAVEASKAPQRANAAAETLRTLVPAAGHLVHMPSHIDVRVGRWMEAAVANEKAIEADRAYRKASSRQGFYHVYMIHNRHFLAWTAMMEGRREAALEAARGMVASVPEEFLKESAALADPSMSIVLDVQKRFGMWDEILREREPAGNLPITRAMWRANRAIALAAKGDVPAAVREREAFLAAKNGVPADTMMSINKASSVLAIAEKLVEAEIDYRRGEVDRAISTLREGARLEDELIYMEPRSGCSRSGTRWGRS